jgi:nuclear transport factor 2 (NTF2) superfamily protein
MRRREASINDVPIRDIERRFRWSQVPRPVDFPRLSELGLKAAHGG